LILPLWAQSDPTFDCLLEFGDNTLDFTSNSSNNGTSSLTCEGRIDSDSLNSAEIYMFPDSELVGTEAALVSFGTPATVSKDGEATTSSPEYELDQTLEIANPARENMCRWADCQSQFTQVPEFR
jgi:hypothetical protein